MSFHKNCETITCEGALVNNGLNNNKEKRPRVQLGLKACTPYGQNPIGMLMSRGNYCVIHQQRFQSLSC